MTEAEILKVAKAVKMPAFMYDTAACREGLAAFVQRIEQRERERCASTCEAEASIEGIAQRCAAAIRSLPSSGTEGGV